LITGSAKFAPAAASFFSKGSGLISLFSGMKPETMTPGVMGSGNSPAAICSAAAARSSAGMASRLARAAVRTWAF
jgi:hypothetical protein